MKHLLTLISALVLVSTSVLADDVKKIKKSRNKIVAVAPFIWGSPIEDFPQELTLPVAKKMQVPVAPFVWGNEGELPETLTFRKAGHTNVAVAPFVLGNPDEKDSIELHLTLAVRAK